MGNECSEHKIKSTVVMPVKNVHTKTQQPKLSKRLNFDQNQLRKAKTENFNIDQFEDIQIISRSASSYVCTGKKRGIQYAIKVCEYNEDDFNDDFGFTTKEKENINKNGSRTRIQFISSNPKSEVELLRKFDHNNIIKYIDSFIDFENNKICIVMEFCPHGDIMKHPFIDLPRAFYQILSAVYYLHMNHVVHQDIKPGNILLDTYGNVKLIDFGAAISVPLSKNKIPVTLMGTPAFFPPEFFTENECDPYAAEVWSLGVTFFQIAFGCIPFQGKNFEECARNIKTIEPDFPSHADSNLVDLIRKMLTKRPEERIILQDIFSHRFFSEKNFSSRINNSPQFYSLKINRKVYC